MPERIHLLELANTEPKTKEPSMSNQPVTSDSRHLTASVVVIDPAAGRVLLVDHKASGKLLFPGGHVDPNETPAEAAIREVFEETAVRVEIVGQAVTSLPGMRWEPSPWMTFEIPAPAKVRRGLEKPAEPPHSHIDLLFLAVADSGHDTSAQLAEVDSAGWYDVDMLGSLRVREEVPVVAAMALDLVRSGR